MFLWFLTFYNFSLWMNTTGGILCEELMFVFVEEVGD